MKKELAHLFRQEPGYTGYAWFWEHTWKGGFMRLKYENGTVLEKASARSGYWVDEGLGGIYYPDFWYDSAKPLTWDEAMDARFDDAIYYSHFDVGAPPLTDDAISWEEWGTVYKQLDAALKAAGGQ